MYFKKSMRRKLFWLVLIALLFLYWRGIKNVGEEKGWNCKYKIVYAICGEENKEVPLPSVLDVLKAGARF